MALDIYNLEIDRILNKIAESKPKRVCVQLPDGLKPNAKEIVDAINSKFPEVKVLIWSGSNFGACDLPLEVERLKVDLLIHIGHSAWVY